MANRTSRAGVPVVRRAPAQANSEGFQVVLPVVPVVPVVVPVVPAVVPVVPVVVPVVPVVPVVVPEVVVLVVPEVVLGAGSSLPPWQALANASDEHSAAPTTIENQLRFIRKEEKTIRNYCSPSTLSHPMYLHLNQGDKGQFYVVLHPAAST